MKNKFFETIATYEKIGDAYLKSIQTSYVPEMKEFLECVPVGGRVLDVGSAGGRDAEVFIQHGFQYVGIDVVARFVNEARKKNPQGTFLIMDVRRLSFPKNSFDAIWANAVLLHIDRTEIPKTLTRMYHVLKPGGKIHIRVKWGKGEKSVAESISQNLRRHFTFFTKKECENYLKKAGFTIIRSRIVPDDLGRKKTRWVLLWAEK